MATINDSVQYLKGVGPAFAKKFEKLGIHTIRDLLLCYPRKYIDYTKPYTVVSAPYDVDSCVRATVLQKEPVRRIKGGRVLVRVLAADDSGVLGLSWFNTPYVADKLIIGQTYYFEGRIGGTMTRRELLHPLVRTEAQVAASPFVAVYPGTEGLPAARQAACAHAALQYVDELADPLPPELLTRYRPDAVAMEQLFFTTNRTTAIAVAEARGVLLLAAEQQGVPVFSYTPLQVKSAVVGYGKAEKEQVMEMTRRLLCLREVPKPDDTADALAIAICHCHASGTALRQFLR